MPPDKFDKLAAAVRKLREDVEAKQQSANRSMKKRSRVNDWWHYTDGLRQAYEADVELLDTLIAEQEIERDG